MTWQEMLLPLYKKYKLNITWGDQDLLNIIFHHNPGETAFSSRFMFVFVALLKAMCIRLYVSSEQSLKLFLI